MRFKLSVLLQGLTLVLFGPACQASSLGLSVNVVPLSSDEGKTVRAHFTAIVPAPCPALSGVCADGEDCLVHTTSLPFTGTKPDSGWCVRQFQKTYPSNFNTTISLGSNAEMYVSVKAGPVVRANTGRINQPAFVALPPPLRARVNCSEHFHLSGKDLDGDRVRCRFALPEQGECLNCTQHSFLALDEDNCLLNFNGKAAAGQYSIHLMVEDLIPVPKFSISQPTDNTPLSSVPLHLSLTVEESTTSCSDGPLITGQTPEEDSTMLVLPYEEVAFNINFTSRSESILEVAVVGPPELFRVGFEANSNKANMSIAWVRSENTLARLLPICFVANTVSLQSHLRCVWLVQREMKTLPPGTELKCDDSQMTLVLPVSSLSKINLTELQLNSPTCPVTYNSTHLTATIPLTGCGTKTVHAGSDLVYTNVLQTVRPFTMISRQPSLVLPLACRIPKVQTKGPQHKIGMPTEREAFGDVAFWIDVYLPGEGPLARFTRTPRFRNLDSSSRRVRRHEPEVKATDAPEEGPGSKIKMIDLHLMSNCSIARAEMIVSNCIESETEDFAVSHPILEKGCSSSNTTLEIVTSQNNSKVYRLVMSSMESNGTTMYIRCTVNLCIATLPSERCPDLCNSSVSERSVVGSLITKTYTLTSGPISLVVTTPAPATTKAGSNNAATTTASAGAATANVTGDTLSQTTTTPATCRAPEKASAIAAGVIITTISMFLQNVFFY